MKKEEIEPFLDKLPFKIKTNEGKFLTVKEIVREPDTSLVFKDKFGSLRSIDINEIVDVYENNSCLNTSTLGGGVSVTNTKLKKKSKDIKRCN